MLLPGSQGLLTNSAPIVEPPPPLYVPSTKRLTMQDLPTPESPCAKAPMVSNERVMLCS